MPRTRRKLTHDDHLADTPEVVLEVANSLVTDIELRRACKCERCTATALLLAGARIGSIHGSSLAEMIAVLRAGYAGSEESLPGAPEGVTVH